MGWTMKQLATVSLAIAAIVSSDKSTTAAPVNVQLTLTTDSGADLLISFLYGVAFVTLPIDFSGTIDVAIDDSLGADVINDSTGLSLSSADIDLSDTTYRALPFIGELEFATTGLGINTLDSHGYIPLSTTNPVAPFEYTFDPGGGSPTEIALDEGLFTFRGGGGVATILGSGTVDFSVDPIVAELNPVGQIGMVTQHAVLSEGHVFVTVSAPLTFLGTKTFPRPTIPDET